MPAPAACAAADNSIDVALPIAKRTDPHTQTLKRARVQRHRAHSATPRGKPASIGANMNTE